MRLIRWFGDTVARSEFWVYLVVYIVIRSLITSDDPFWVILPGGVVASLVMSAVMRHLGPGANPGEPTSNDNVPAPGASISVRAAVDRGHNMITKPVFAIMGAVAALGLLLMVAFDLVIVGLVAVVAAPSVGWLWWSYATPRWREWALNQGVNATALQRLAQREMLVWPKGHIFERTEFRIRR